VAFLLVGSGIGGALPPISYTHLWCDGMVLELIFTSTSSLFPVAFSTDTQTYDCSVHSGTWKTVKHKAL